MVLGSFDFDTLHKNLKDDTERTWLAIFLFMLLVFLGSLVLVNLFVALIVCDVDSLMIKAEKQTALNKAQNIVVFNSLLRYEIFTKTF